MAFGRLIGGIPLLRRLEALPTDAADRPTEAALISDCGELEAAQVASLMDAGLDDEEASGVCLWRGGAARRGRGAKVAARCASRDSRIQAAGLRRRVGGAICAAAARRRCGESLCKGAT